MEEVSPVLAGIVVGLIIHAIVALRARCAVLAVLSVVFGVLASWMSGELAISVIYMLVDVAQVLGAALGTWALAAAWARRSLTRGRARST